MSVNGGRDMDKADHSGHRDRLRKKYEEFGIEALAPHEVLELLLFYAVPYRNTNDIAKKLLDSFGSLSAVLDATVGMLTEEGLTRNQAIFLRLIPDVSRRYLLDKHDDPGRVMDRDRLASFITDQFIGIEGKELVILVLLDIKGKLLFSGKIAEGEFNAANISKRKILRLALNYNAISAVLAHNHPSGFAMPSVSDFEATLDIKKALEAVGVRLLDHYIVADNDAVSMAETFGL